MTPWTRRRSRPRNPRGGRYWFTRGWNLPAVAAWTVGATFGVLAVNTTLYVGPLPTSPAASTSAPQARRHSPAWDVPGLPAHLRTGHIIQSESSGLIAAVALGARVTWSRSSCSSQMSRRLRASQTRSRPCANAPTPATCSCRQPRGGQDRLADCQHPAQGVAGAAVRSSIEDLADGPRSSGLTCFGSRPTARSPSCSPTSRDPPRSTNAWATARVA